MKKDIKKFLIKGSLFILFTLLFIIPEIIFINTSNTFRVWESVATSRLNKNRPFYVDKTIHKIEYGDLGYNTKYAIKKDVIWHTDNWGYRNDVLFSTYDIVVIGDSHMVGSSLTQNQTYVNSLMEQSNYSAYSYAKANINNYLSEKRFIDTPPKIVIVESIERTSFRLPKIIQPKEIISDNNIIFVEKIEDYFDNIIKFSFYRTIFSRAGEKIIPKDLIVNDKTNMLFLKQSLDFRINNLNNINETIKTIKEYNEYFSNRNIQFIFLIIPDKESLYSSELPEEYKEYREYTGYIPKLIAELKKENITVIDIYTPLINITDTRYYHLDDDHWNYNAVKLASNVSIDVINNLRVH